MDGQITVARYRDPALAELAKSKLVAEGIECELVDEQTIAVNWLWSDLLGGVKVRVPEPQAAEARMLLGEEEAAAENAPEPADVLPASERCPVCGSAQVRRVDGRRGVAAAMLLWANLIPIWPRRWRAREACGVCGADWQPRPRRAADELYCALDTGPERDPQALARAGRWILLVAMAAVAVWMARQP